MEVTTVFDRHTIEPNVHHVVIMCENVAEYAEIKRLMRLVDVDAYYEKTIKSKTETDKFILHFRDEGFKNFLQTWGYI